MKTTLKCWSREEDLFFREKVGKESELDTLKKNFEAQEKKHVENSLLRSRTAFLKLEMERLINTMDAELFIEFCEEISVKPTKQNLKQWCLEKNLERPFLLHNRILKTHIENPLRPHALLRKDKKSLENASLMMNDAVVKERREIQEIKNLSSQIQTMQFVLVNFTVKLESKQREIKNLQEKMKDLESKICEDKQSKKSGIFKLIFGFMR